MAKAKIAFVCDDCGADHSKWQGQCAACSAWNTLKQVNLGPAKPGRGTAGGRLGYAGGRAEVKRLDAVGTEQRPRVATGIGELDRVLGGGLVHGSVLLLGGHPGAGKSTLLLQVATVLAARHGVLYVTGEESLEQVALRARRLGLPDDALLVASETRVGAIADLYAEHKPTMLVVDSIQVMESEDVDGAPGGVTQVRECAASLTRLAKQSGAIVWLVGHVTKEGGIAGPKVLEHMIDCFMMLEGDADGRYRTLRSQKNRFGAVNELGVFAMTGKGLKEVPNPSAIFLQRGEQPAAGSVVTTLWEGTRPLLVELQALVDEAAGDHPRRVAVGLDAQRLAMHLAVLHRHGGVRTGNQDVFANAVGGVRVSETAADLALALAVVSSLRDQPLPPELVVFGELGLAGEVRPVPNGQERLREAAKHGFRRAIVPLGNQPKQPPAGMQVQAVAHLKDALAAIGR